MPKKEQTVEAPQIKVSDVTFFPKQHCKQCYEKGFLKVYSPDSFTVHKKVTHTKSGKKKVDKRTEAFVEPTLKACLCLHNQISKHLNENEEANKKDFAFAPLVIDDIQKVVVVPSHFLKEDDETTEDENKLKK